MPTRIIALELGTTNSAVGYRDFDGGKPITDEEIVSVGLYNALPTCIVEADKNPHISRDIRSSRRPRASGTPGETY